ncbi:MAG: hypothetical protein GC154_00440 [bacterium]|nr:hypothetical protein [bacterium]
MSILRCGGDSSITIREVSPLKRFALYLTVAALMAACSNSNQGEFVESSSTPAPPMMAQSSGSDLPAGHPPVGGQGAGQQQSMLEPGPKQEPAVIEGGKAVSAGLSFSIDPSWKSEKPSSSFRAAQFDLPAPEGAEGDAELALFQGIGGSAQMNIDRWIGQFTQPDGSDSKAAAKVAHLDVGNFHVETLDITGNYGASMSMAPMASGSQPKTGQRMLAAVVEGAGGPWHWKLVGPEATVEHWKPAFDQLIQSMKPAP